MTNLLAKCKLGFDRYSKDWVERCVLCDLVTAACFNLECDVCSEGKLLRVLLYGGRTMTLPIRQVSCNQLCRCIRVLYDLHHEVCTTPSYQAETGSGVSSYER